jgi:hypothetical protein
MMKTDGLENELRNLKFIHLSERELAAYLDQELDQINRSRMAAHIEQCFICERQLELLQEENAALSQRTTTAEDVAFVERLIERTGPAQNPSAQPTEATRGIAVRERLAEYLQGMVASWRICFGQGALRGESDQGEEVWRWQSEDGKLQAYATMEKNADLTFHFSATEMNLEGARLHFRLGALRQDLTLQRVSETEIGAEIAIPWPYRQGNVMADISIEIV